MLTEVAGFNETQAAAIFAPQAHFMLGCQMAPLIIDTFLAGVLAMQVNTYFTYQSGDRFWVKCIVAYTAMMNVVVTVYYWVFSQHLFVENFGYWLWLENMPLLDALTVSAVQFFFAHRAFLLLGGRYIILIPILLLIATGFASTIGVKILFHRAGSLLEASSTGPPLITWLACTTAADIIIATCILTGLLRSKTGWAHTDKLVTRLIRLTFEAQLPPTFLSIGYVAEWIVQPDSLLGAVFQALQSKAYTVGLLVCLNSRLHFRSGNTEAYSSGSAQIYGTSKREYSRNQPAEITVHVETETYYQTGAEIATPRNTNRVTDLDDSHESIEMGPAVGYDSRAKLTEAESV
ncbi:hypothetical protein JCM24511_05203 [Saitozyma sp. JCM 24511]|nr:hypothetical protein JCM24511_05203 [Saitozyma sp. JCM 24511]